MINNLEHHNNGSWSWRRAENSRGCYYTNNDGEGIFFQSDKTGETKQFVGTCQFSACKTASGMRRKLNRYSLFGEHCKDPSI